MNQNENDYVSLVRIPRKWFNVFVWTFSSLVIANVLIEFFTDWAWKNLGETVLTRTAVLMTLIVGWFFILAHIWEVIMLGYAKLFKDKILAQGRAEGRAEGKAEGRAEVYRELQQAQKKGITLEELLKTHDAKNGKNESDESSSSKNG
ncbi:hypothetical protein C6503_12380 [Candidatus Poribacteria bacterium]|nr:MAG: hypothetical protein C6503_12380 [Candidatus Poribacteria bacterium]